MPRISLYSPSIASAVLPQGYVPRDASLFGEGRTLPSGGASTSTMAGGQKGVFGSDGGGAMGTIAGMLGGSGLRSVFFGAPEDPRAAQARAAAENYAAQAAKTREETRALQAEAAGRSKLGAAFGELRTRQQPTAAEPSPALARIISEEPYAHDARAEPADSEAARMRAAGAARMQEAIAAGAKPEVALALARAFMLEVGDEDQISLLNSSVGTYLKDGETLSPESQAAKIAEAEANDTARTRMQELTKVFDFQSRDATSRANNTDDNVTSRANNAATNATSVRTNNADNTSAERRLRYEKIFDATLGNAPVQTTETKFNADGTVDKKQVRTQRQPVPSSAPARAAPARGAAQPPKRIKFDAQGNPIQ